MRLLAAHVTPFLLHRKTKVTATAFCGRLSPPFCLGRSLTALPTHTGASIWAAVLLHFFSFACLACPPPTLPLSLSPTPPTIQASRHLHLPLLRLSIFVTRAQQCSTKRRRRARRKSFCVCQEQPASRSYPLPPVLLSSPREGSRRHTLKGTTGVLKVKLMPGHTMRELALAFCEWKDIFEKEKKSSMLEDTHTRTQTHICLAKAREWPAPQTLQLNEKFLLPPGQRSSLMSRTCYFMTAFFLSITVI